LVADEKGANFGGGARAEAPQIYGQYMARVDKALETSTTAELTVRATASGDHVSVTADVTKLPKDAKNLRLHLVLAERELKFGGENGIRFHSMVVRAVAGDQATGLPLAANGKREYTFNLAAVREDILKSLAEEIANRRSRQAPGATPAVFAAEGRALTHIDLSHLVVVAYVQDANKHVLQAARADVAPASAGKAGG
jgi:hypothetical protein